MAAYMFRRLVAIVPTLIVLSIILFVMVRLMPGNAALLKAFSSSPLQQSANSTKAVAQYEHELGLDKPIPVQYLEWIGDTARLKFGNSYFTGSSAVSELKRRGPVTLELMVFSVLISTLIGVTVGVVSAIFQDTPIDFACRVFATFGLSLPAFWVGIMVILLPALWWHIVLPSGNVSILHNPVANLKVFIVPSVVLGWAFAGSLMRVTRSEMLETLRQDYVRTARAKGLGELIVIYRHVLRNAFIPIITLVGLQVGILIGGAVVIEQVFGLPGVGSFLLTAIGNRDYPVIQSVVLLAALAFLLTTLIVDLSYGVLDPRIRYE